MPVLDDELRKLWHGDHDSDGYVHATLALEACRRARPGTVADLARFFYQQAPDRLDVIASRALEEGHRLWLAERKVTV